MTSSPIAKDQMKITFIQTGGTVDKDYPRSQGGYAFEITTPAIERILDILSPGFEFEVIPLLQKDSLDITDEDRDLILTTCRTTPSTRIVITHGTDSILETAAFISSITDKTIVLTGALRPEWFKNSDAHANLGVAIGAVQSLDSGVYIVMHGQAFTFDRVIRDQERGRFVEK